MKYNLSEYDFSNENINIKIIDFNKTKAKKKNLHITTLGK